MIIRKVNKIFDNNLSKHLFFSMLIQGVYTIITPLSMVLLARFLGPEDFGKFSFSSSFVIIVSIFASLGLPVVVTRYGAIYYIKRQWDKFQGLISFSNKAVFLTGLFLIAIIAIIIKFNVYEIPSSEYVLLALPIVLFLSLSTLRTAILTAIEKVNTSQLPELIIRPILFFVFILVLYYTGQLNVSSTVISYVLANAIIFFIGALWVKKYTKQQFRNRVKTYEVKNWRKSALPLFLLGSVQVFGAQADIFLLGFLANSEEVGVFKSMYQISLLVIFSLTAVNAVASPYIVRSFEDGNFSRIKKLLFTFCTINLLFASIISLPFLIFGEFMVGLIFGQEFTIGVSCLYILIIGRIINSIFGVSNQFLKMMGEERKATKGIVLGTFVGVFLNVVLIPKYGIVGAALASSAGLITWNAYLFTALVRKIYSRS